MKVKSMCVRASRSDPENHGGRTLRWRHWPDQTPCRRRTLQRPRGRRVAGAENRRAVKLGGGEHWVLPPRTELSPDAWWASGWRTGAEPMWPA